MSSPRASARRSAAAGKAPRSTRGANLFLCDTEDDLRRIDAALNETTPEGGRGARTSVEMYEVLLDEELNG